MQTSLLDYQKISKGELRIDEIGWYIQEGRGQWTANYTGPEGFIK